MERKEMMWAAGLFFMSGVFWMSNTVDLAGWSLYQLTALFVLALSIFKKATIEIPEQKFLTPWLMLAALAALSMQWSSNAHATQTAFYKILWIMATLTVFLSDREQWSQIIPVAAAILALSASAAWLLLTAPALAWMNYPNLFGGFLALSGTLSAGEALRGSKLKALHLACVSMAALAVFTMGSLGPIAALISGVAVQVAVLDRTRAWIAVTAMAVFFMAGLGLSRAPGFHNLIQRKINDPYATERISLWKDSLRYFKRHPVLGTGMGTYRDYYPEYKTIPGLRVAPYAHSEPLNALCETGLLGAALLTMACVPVAGAILAGPPSVWLGVLTGGTVHALMDFNLHYPPILILMIAAIAFHLGSRPLYFKSKGARAGIFIFLGFAGVVVFLPGLADALFRRAFTKEPTERIRAAHICMRLDPFNAFYRTQTGRMRDVAVAIELEPRNVWYRRSAAQFHVSEWERTGDPLGLVAAMEQYREILTLSPNVPQFQREMSEIHFKSQEQDRWKKPIYPQGTGGKHASKK